MKRVLFIIPFLSSGGAERVVSIWSSELAKNGNDIHLLVFYRVKDEYKVNDKVVIHTIRNTKEEYESMSKLQKIKEIRKILKSVRPNIVIPFITYVGILVNIAKIGL
ncbi:MAG: glycosyltransferase, partial [Peptostreptococcaceae bacterium]|nr:glycosyltransferase [Peptostreptococcaceae bacterium]